MKAHANDLAIPAEAAREFETRVAPLDDSPESDLPIVGEIFLQNKLTIEGDAYGARPYLAHFRILSSVDRRVLFDSGEGFTPPLPGSISRDGKWIATNFAGRAGDGFELVSAIDWTRLGIQQPARSWEFSPCEFSRDYRWIECLGVISPGYVFVEGEVERAEDDLARYVRCLGSLGDGETFSCDPELALVLRHVDLDAAPGLPTDRGPLDLIYLRVDEGDGFPNSESQP